MDTAFVLEDLTRNASVHAAGVVIGDQPLVNLLPLKKDEDGAIVTQYAMGPVGDLGLLKMDFLGLKTLTVIRNTCDLARQFQGVEIPIDNLPLDDAKTYDLLNKANTIGIFQLESGGMRDLCRRFQISSVEHITALVALYRPGPMDLIPDFIRRRHGEIKIEYEHPLLEPITRETYGVLIYQEQVMQAAQALAGFTLGGADLLRRAMGKKKAEEMARQREVFVKGCAKVNSIPAAKANQIFDLLEKFAGYGFNKSHAAAYAMVAYQTAWLKANYPVEFLSAMMTNDMGDTAKLGILIGEARQFPHRSAAAGHQRERRLFHAERGGDGGRRGHGDSIRPGGGQGHRGSGGGRHPGGAGQGREIHLAGRSLRAGGRADCQPEMFGGADQVRRLRRFRRNARHAFFQNGPGADAGGRDHPGPQPRAGHAFWDAARGRGQGSRRRKSNCRNGRSMNCWRTKRSCSVFT